MLNFVCVAVCYGYVCWNIICVNNNCMNSCVYFSWLARSIFEKTSVPFCCVSNRIALRLLLQDHAFSCIICTREWWVWSNGPSHIDALLELVSGTGAPLNQFCCEASLPYTWTPCRGRCSMQAVYRLVHIHKRCSQCILYMLVGLATEIRMPIERIIMGI